MRVAVTYEAMATTFQIVAVSDDPRYVRQAAAEAFAELDRIEARLSRFAEGSDIWRINHLRAGEATFVHHDTFECLRIAEQVRRDTSGAFDVAYPSGMPPPHAPSVREGSRKRPARGRATSGTLVATPTDSDRTPPLIALDEASHTVRVLAEGTQLDLGGVGKGFALDRMAALLKEWGISSALLCASTSTILALGAPPGEEGWPVQCGPDEAPQHLKLANQALSASGTAVKGSHIIDPRTGRPAEGRLRAWAIAPTAAVADTLSTAFMVMGDEETRAYCRCHAAIAAHLTSHPAGARIRRRKKAGVLARPDARQGT